MLYAKFKSIFCFSIIEEDRPQQDCNSRVRLVQAREIELGQTESDQPIACLLILCVQIRQHHVLNGISTQTQGQQFWYFPIFLNFHIAIFSKPIKCKIIFSLNRHHLQLPSSWYHRLRNMEKRAVPVELGLATDRQDHV